jgi:hypothetical protein
LWPKSKFLARQFFYLMRFMLLYLLIDRFSTWISHNTSSPLNWLNDRESNGFFSFPIYNKTPVVYKNTLFFYMWLGITKSTLGRPKICLKFGSSDALLFALTTVKQHQKRLELSGVVKANKRASLLSNFKHIFGRPKILFVIPSHI